jgi:hypothetical protein
MSMSKPDSLNYVKFIRCGPHNGLCRNPLNLVFQSKADWMSSLWEKRA